MKTNQLTGIVLLIGGIILLYFGYQASQSVADQVVESFTGRFTDATMWYFIFGGIGAVAGLFLLGSRRS